MYFKIIDDGFILGLAVGFGSIEISEQEYNELTAIFHAMPTAREGYEYKLTENREWVEVEKPSDDDPATDEDYENALSDLGVRL